MKERITIDFDGTIVSWGDTYKSVEDISGNLIDGAFEFITSLMDEGFQVCISSSRMSERAGMTAVKNWFLNHNFKREGELEYSYGKLPAKLYMDDRALPYNGGAYPSIEFIKNFKPYYERNKVNG